MSIARIHRLDFRRLLCLHGWERLRRRTEHQRPQTDLHASSYWAELLERYRHDTRVWAISGDNFQDGQWRGSGSYYFSHLPHCWGWANWRRAWRPQPPIPQCGGTTLLGWHLGAAAPPQPAGHMGTNGIIW